MNISKVQGSNIDAKKVGLQFQEKFASFLSLRKTSFEDANLEGLLVILVVCPPI